MSGAGLYLQHYRCARDGRRWRHYARAGAAVACPGCGRATAAHVEGCAPVTGAEVRALMRVARVTIGQVAASGGLTQARVRQVRAEGGPWDWPLIVQAARDVHAG